jgi:hypothetical protein
MKFLDFSSLARLCAFLDNVDVGEYQVHGDIEAYSCKLAGLDKKLCRSLEQEVQISSSPQELSRSPVGPLSEPQSRKTLIYLILTLNHIYPDYDFNQLRAQHFQKEADVTVVEEAVDSHLLEVSRIWEQSPSGANTSFFDTIWGSIDEAIDMQNCDVYSYKGDGEIDPLSEKGNVWSFNYFFYNKKLKRILYFTCRGQSKTAEDSRNTNTNSGVQFPENKSDADEDSSTMYGMAQSMDL